MNGPLEPFSFFDRIYCIRLDDGTAAWNAFAARLEQLGIAARVQVLRVDPRVVDRAVSVALVHRRLLEESLAAEAARVLVFEDHALLLADMAIHLDNIVAELSALDARAQPWALLHLGAVTWGNEEEALPGCQHLVTCAGSGGTYAFAYHRPAIEQILAELPADIPQLGDWTARHLSFDRFLATLPNRLLTRPRLASLSCLLPYEDPATRDGFLV
jgi:hypothetical protein